MAGQCSGAGLPFFVHNVLCSHALCLAAPLQTSCSTARAGAARARAGAAGGALRARCRVCPGQGLGAGLGRRAEARGRRAAGWVTPLSLGRLLHGLAWAGPGKLPVMGQVPGEVEPLPRNAWDSLLCLACTPRGVLASPEEPLCKFRKACGRLGPSRSHLYASIRY